MYKFADLVDKHTEELALWETKSMGQPISVARLVYTMFGKMFRYYAGWTDKLPGESWSEDEQGIYKVWRFRSDINDFFRRLHRLSSTILLAFVLELVLGTAQQSSSLSKLPLP